MKRHVSKKRLFSAFPSSNLCLPEKEKKGLQKQYNLEPTCWHALCFEVWSLAWMVGYAQAVLRP